MQKHPNQDNSQDYPHQSYPPSYFQQQPQSYPQQPYPNYPQHPYPNYPQQPYPSNTQTYSTYPNSPGYTNQAFSDPDPEISTMSGSYAPPGGEDPTTNFDFTERSIRLGFIRYSH